VTLRCYLRGDFSASIEQLMEQSKEMTREWGVLDVTAAILEHEAAVAAERL
jgi:acetolactate synthase small subunit